MNKLYCILLVFCFSAHIVVANPVVKGAREIVEAIVKKGGAKAPKELIEFGGEKAVQEVLKKTAKEGGDELVEKAIKYGRKYGLAAVKTIDNAPALYIKALDGIPEALVERALWAAQREPAIMTRLLSQYGSDALHIAARHRGVGTDIVAKLGDDGVRMARNLSEDQAVILARHADDIAGLPSSQKNQVVEAMLAAPKQVVEYLEKHPKAFLTAGGIIAVVKLKDDVLGDGKEVVIGPDGKPIIGLDGKPITRKRGFLERILDQFLDRFHKLVLAVLVIIAVFLGSWCAVKIWGCYRRERVKVTLAEKSIADASQTPSETESRE